MWMFSANKWRYSSNNLSFNLWSLIQELFLNYVGSVLLSSMILKKSTHHFFITCKWSASNLLRKIPPINPGTLLNGFPVDLPAQPSPLVWDGEKEGDSFSQGKKNPLVIGTPWSFGKLLQLTFCSVALHLFPFLGRHLHFRKAKFQFIAF